MRRRRGRGWSLRQIHRLRQRRLSLRVAGLLREQARLPCRQAREIRIRRRVAQHARCRWRERLCPPSLRLRLRSTDRLGPRCLRGGFIRLRRSTRVLRGALGWGMARDALAHRLQTVEQPSPILLVIEQAVDLPPVSRLRLLILAQDVIERVRGPHHGRPPQPSSVWELPGSAVLQFARCKWGSRPKLLSFVAPACPASITPRPASRLLGIEQGCPPLRAVQQGGGNDLIKLNDCEGDG